MLLCVMTWQLCKEEQDMYKVRKKCVYFSVLELGQLLPFMIDSTRADGTLNLLRQVSVALLDDVAKCHLGLL